MLHFFNLLGMRFGVDSAWRFVSLWLPLLALLVGGAAGAWGGWTQGRAALRADIAELRTAHAEALRLTQQAAARRLQDAQQRSDTLSTALAETITKTTTLQQEKTHALRLAATGRVCLDARALGVLNTSPGLRVTGLDGVPTSQPGLAAAGATLGPDTDHPSAAPNAQGAPGLTATDTDIGAWAIGAGAAYEACRARLDALIDWHASNTTEAAQ